MKLYDIGDGWEKANGVLGADRDIIAIKISSNVEVEDKNKPEVLIVSAHHAREIITPEITITLIKNIIDGYNRGDAKYRYFVDKRQIWIIPFGNPDGHNYVANKDGNWRKNRRKFSTDYGVDLNRNFPYKWGFDNSGSSGSVSSLSYRGPSPASEPETQCQRDFVLAHNFQYSLSLHAYGNYYLNPWAHTGKYYSKDQTLFLRIGDSLAVKNKYKRGTPKDVIGYTANGDFMDFCYSDSAKVSFIGFAAEIGTSSDTFAPPESRIIPLVNENLPACEFLIRNADDPYLKRPQLTQEITTNGNFKATFETKTPLDSLIIYYTINNTKTEYKLKLSKIGNNVFEGKVLTYGYIGKIDYYYSAYFENRNITYPYYAPYQRRSFTTTSNINYSSNSDKKLYLNAYPNPFNSVVTINYKIESDLDSKLRVYDVEGKELFSRNLDKKSINHNIDFSTFKSGVYFIEIGNSDKKLVRKVNFIK